MLQKYKQYKDDTKESKRQWLTYGLHIEKSHYTKYIFWNNLKEKESRRKKQR